ncbi:MAG TPA: hypothetical protein VIK72_17455 [Clostridiaceae bacterium]
MTFLIILIISCCYYTLTYGLSLWKNGNNKEGSIFTILIAFLGTVIPIYYIFLIS